MSKKPNKRPHFETKLRNDKSCEENIVLKRKLKKVLKNENILDSFSERNLLDDIESYTADDFYENLSDDSTNPVELSLPILNYERSLAKNNVNEKSKANKKTIEDVIEVKNTSKVESDMINTISSILTNNGNELNRVNKSQICEMDKVESIEVNVSKNITKSENNMLPKKNKKTKKKNKTQKLDTSIPILDERFTKTLLNKISNIKKCDENSTSNSTIFDLNDELANEIKTNIKKGSINDTCKSQKMQSPKENKFCILDDGSYNFLSENREKFDFRDSVVEIFDKSYKNSTKKVSVVNGSNKKSEHNNLSEIVDSIDLSENVSTLADIADNKVVEDMFKIFSIGSACIGILKHSSKVFFCGKLKASTLYGNVEVLGYQLTRKPKELYSVCTASLLCFETTKCDENADFLFSNLQAIGVNVEKIAEIINYTTIGDAVLFLEPLNNVMTDFVNKHLTNFNIFSRTKNPDTDEVYNILKCKFYNEGSMSVFVKNETWNDVMQMVTFPQEPLCKNVTMICGGKDVGKSTMLRYLVNKSLEYGPSLVLDFDPGQPEFTICGLLSVTVVENPLLGPNFTHLLTPERSLCLGYINVTENEKRYINAIVDLVEHCRNSEKYNKMSWIVNTMGFVGTKGYNLLVNIMNIIQPTAVIEIKSFLPNQNFRSQLTADNTHSFQESDDYESYINDDATLYQDYKYFLLEPFQCQTGKPPTVCKHIEAKSERLLNVLAYFSKMATEKYTSILNIKPYMVPYDALGLLFNNLFVDGDHLLSVLNGRLVALCHRNDADRSKIRKLKDEPVVCFGHGLIRGVDPINRMLYILTPLGANVLKDVNALVHADTLPDCSSVLSVPNMPLKMMVPYTAPLKVVSKHKHLHQIPKRKLNPLRIIEMAKRS